ncbi:transposase, partial [Streptococcus pseudopneumoniae G42]
MNDRYLVMTRLHSNAKLEATNNLIKLIKRNVFGFRNFENFKKRIFIALN